MASRGYKYLSEKGTHHIGNLNTKWTTHIANGAIATEDFDNFLLVETDYDLEGNLTCKVLTDATKKGYLATTVEEEHLLQDGGFSEELPDFYNGKGEVVRITDVKEQVNSRFETSAFSLNEDVVAAKVGFVAHFDPASKTYLVSDPTDLHADYNTAVNKFKVVDVDTDLGYAFDKTTIRLQSI